MKNTNKILLAGLIGLLIIGLVAISGCIYKEPPSAVNGSSSTVNDIFISESYGKINRVPIEGSKYTVVWIQDQHCTPKLQQNIINAIRELTQKHNLKLIGTEGSTGYIDVSWFIDLPEVSGMENAKYEIAQTLLENGEISGVEFLMVTERGKWDIYGVEDEQLYQEHLRVTQELGDIEDQIGEDMIQIIYDLEDKLSDDDALELSDKLEEYYEDDLSLTELYDYLEKASKEQGISTSKFASFYKFLETNKTFDDVTRKRGEKFVEQIISEMEEKDEKLAVLVAGGAHVEIEEKLKEKKASYIVFEPIGFGTENRYYEVMYRKNSVFEEELLKKFIPPRSWLQRPTSAYKAESWYKSYLIYQMKRKGFTNKEIENALSKSFSGRDNLAKVDFTLISGTEDFYIPIKIGERDYIFRLSEHPIEVSTPEILESGKLTDEVYYEILEPSDISYIKEEISNARYVIDSEAKKVLDKIADSSPAPYEVVRNTKYTERLLLKATGEMPLSARIRFLEYDKIFKNIGEYPEMKSKRVLMFNQKDESTMQIIVRGLDNKGGNIYKIEDIPISSRFKEFIEKWNKADENTKYDLLTEKKYLEDLSSFIQKIDTVVGENTIILDGSQFREYADILNLYYGDDILITTKHSLPKAVAETLKWNTQVTIKTSDVVVIVSSNPKYPPSAQMERINWWKDKIEKINKDLDDEKIKLKIVESPDEVFQIMNEMKGKGAVVIRVGETGKDGSSILPKGEFYAKDMETKVDVNPDRSGYYMNCKSLKGDYSDTGSKIGAGINIGTTREILDEDVIVFLEPFTKKLKENGGNQLDASQYAINEMRKGMDHNYFFIKLVQSHLKENPGDMEGAIKSAKDTINLLKEGESDSSLIELRNRYNTKISEGKKPYKAIRELSKELDLDRWLVGLYAKESRTGIQIVIDSKGVGKVV